METRGPALRLRSGWPIQRRAYGKSSRKTRLFPAEWGEKIMAKIYVCI